MSGTIEEVEVAEGLVLLTRHWEQAAAVATVVLVHGAADHSGRWSHVAEYLSGASFDVHAYDMRGHGRSGGHPMYVETFDDFLVDLEVILTRATVPGRPTVIYGHSLGGLVGAAYGVSDRPQPDRFVLSAPALGSTTPRILRALAYGLGGILPKMTAPTVFKKEQLSRDPAVGDAYVADPHVHSRGSLRLGKEAFRAMAETTQRLDRLSVPTLVIHGSDDQLVPAGVSEPLASLPNVERKVFDGLRHEMHNEPEAEVVLGVVAGWLHGQFADAGG